jgi:ABC-type Fe3+ transport system permease subunit
MILVIWIAIGTVVPVASLIWQTGSWTTWVEQLRVASDRIVFTLVAGGLAATGMVLLAIPLAAYGSQLKHPTWLDVFIFAPLAAPPLLLGVGLIRTWNRPGLDAIYLGIGVVVLAMIGRYLAFGYLPIGGALERLDPGMFDAARLAGASAPARGLRIGMPLLASPVLAAWCVSFCFTLRELDTLIMLRAGQQSLTFHLYAHVVFARQSELAAIALVLAALHSHRCFSSC